MRARIEMEGHMLAVRVESMERASWP